MSGTTLNAGNLDPLRRKLLFRAWHRGMREMDLLMGAFADAHIETMTDDELQQFEQIITYPDADLFKWFKGEDEIPDHYDLPLLRRFLSFKIPGI